MPDAIKPCRICVFLRWHLLCCCLEAVATDCDCRPEGKDRVVFCYYIQAAAINNNLCTRLYLVVLHIYLLLGMLLSSSCLRKAPRPRIQFFVARLWHTVHGRISPRQYIGWCERQVAKAAAEHCAYAGDCLVWHRQGC